VKSGLITPIEDNSAGASETSELFGLILEEEFKNLIKLEQFIILNPDNLDAMDIYCENAAKFLPNKELEQKILNYSR
jgi:hypothetical protein